jgi:predicted Zn finger-like uncharacterized protein
MFKVVPDQLRISEGWVRCGHCAEVFDASANMQQDVAFAPQAYVAPPPASVAAPPVYAPQPVYTHAPVHIPAPTVSQAFAPPAPAASYLASRERRGPDSQSPSSTFSDSQLDRNLYKLLADDAAPESLPQADAAPSLSRPAPLAASRTAQLEAFDDSRIDPEAPVSDSTLESVSFVRDARHKAFWRRPAIRILLSLVVLALLGVLGLQVAVQERDRIAAMEPRTRGLLQDLCSRLQCSVEPLRQIESIVIDSSAFNKLRADTYRLSITVKNNAPLALAMPAIELALTDSGDQPVVRRVLTPADLGAAAANTSPVLAAGGEWSGTFPISVVGGGARIVGYRLLAFYP